MSSLAEEFSDPDSLYTKRRRIVLHASGGTALENFDDLVVRYPYESDAPTTHSLRGGSFSLPRIASALSSIVQAFEINLSQRTRYELRTLSDLGIIEPYFVFSRSSTLPSPFTWPSEPPTLELDWSSCLAGFVDEEIEDGMTASLGEKISNLIRFHGSEAIKRLKELISSNEVSPSLASHTLRWLGRIEDPASFDSRLELLCESLQSKSPLIRDGAALGLAVLRSPKAIEHLQAAIKQEMLPGLRADLEQVLRKLQN